MQSCFLPKKGEARKGEGLCSRTHAEAQELCYAQAALHSTARPLIPSKPHHFFKEKVPLLDLRSRNLCKLRVRSMGCLLTRRGWHLDAEGWAVAIPSRDNWETASVLRKFAEVRAGRVTSEPLLQRGCADVPVCVAETKLLSNFAGYRIRGVLLHMRHDTSHTAASQHSTTSSGKN